MNRRNESVSPRTSRRWWLVALLIVLGIGVFASSVYFLLVPAGFQGGRNPYYQIVLIFNRETWDGIHLWTGLGMILILFVHIILHWEWIKMMTHRFVKSLVSGTGKMNWRARYNVLVDLLAGLSFLLASFSGIYLLFTPSRYAAASAPVVIFGWYGWDLIHTWSGIVMFILVFLHFYIHWVWIVNVGKKKLGLGVDSSKLELEGAKNG